MLLRAVSSWTATILRPNNNVYRLTTTTTRGQIRYIQMYAVELEETNVGCESTFNLRTRFTEQEEWRWRWWTTARDSERATEHERLFYFFLTVLNSIAYKNNARGLCRAKSMNELLL